MDISALHAHCRGALDIRRPVVSDHQTAFRTKPILFQQLLEDGLVRFFDARVGGEEDAVEKRGQAQLVQLRHREGRLGVGQQVYALSSGSQGAQHFSRLGVQPDVTKGQGAKEQSGIRHLLRAGRHGLAGVQAFENLQDIGLDMLLGHVGEPGRASVDLLRHGFLIHPVQLLLAVSRPL